MKTMYEMKDCQGKFNTVTGEWSDPVPDTLLQTSVKVLTHVDPPDQNGMDKMLCMVTNEQNGRSENFEYSMGIGHRITSKSSVLRMSGDITRIPHRKVTDDDMWRKCFYGGRMTEHGWKRFLKETQPLLDPKDLIYALHSDYRMVEEAGVQDMTEYLEDQGLVEGMRANEVIKMARSLRENAVKFLNLGYDLAQLEEFFQDY